MHIGIAGPEERESWNAFVVKHSGPEFLQSWGWGDFQRSYGRPVWRFVVKKDDDIYAVATAICTELRRGRRFVYVPRAPIMKDNLSTDTKKVIWSLFTQQWRLIGLESNALFVRVEPAVMDEVGKEDHTKRVHDFLLGRGWLPVKHVQPRYTSILNIEKSEDALLGAMHQKTRYNIRLAEKKGLKFRMITKEKEFKTFWELHSRAAERDNFQTYSYDYYRKMFNILLDEDDKPDVKRAASRVFVVEKEDGTPLASALIITFGKRVVYLFGGSDYNHRNLMAPYLLHWSIIKRAKKNGFKEYDFWGISGPQEKQEHSWQGFSRFKKGFGGTSYGYLGAYDFPYKERQYKAYQLLRKIKKVLPL